MEANSLLGGVASLASLFSTCMDALEKISTYKSFSNDSKALETQFRANKLHLQRWGQAVGFEDGQLLYDHHPALNDDETISMVEDILRIINSLSQANEAVPDRLGRVSSRFKQSQRRNPCRPSASKMERVAWTILGKGRREDEVKLFAELIQQLHNLVPPHLEERLQIGVPPYQASQDKLERQTSVLSEVKHFLSKREDERKVELLRDLESWILGVHSSGDIFEDIAQTRLNGTCDWILQNPEFSSWLAEHSSSPAAQLLWIHGPAGFGKTVLFTRVVEYLSEIPISLVAYFFFSSDFERLKEPFTAVRSWLCQIMRQEPAAFEIIYDAWLAQEAQILSQPAIEKLFIDVLKITPGCILALDGLDECPSIEKVIKLVGQATKEPNIRVLIMSRGEPEIRQALEDHTADNFREYKISIEDVRADTALYSRDIVNQKLSNKSNAIRGDIASRISDRCDGQFLWVKMQADSLRKGMNQMQLQRKVSETPIGLGHIYERNWDSIIRQQKEEMLRAVTLLRWAAFSIRPLTVSEITEATLIDDDSTEIPIEELPDELDTYYVNSEIVGLCDSLIELRGNKEFVGSMTVHVTHFSVKQFLLLKITSPERFKESNGDLNTSYETFQNAFLAKKCLQYISFARVWDNARHGKLWNPGASFRQYAASAWFRHTVLVQSNDIKLTESINNFFSSATGGWDAWRRWYDTTTIKTKTDEDPEPTPLHYACGLRLTETLKYLLDEQNHDVNQAGWAKKETPLGIACEMGHEVLVETLLKSGASLTVENHIGRTPIYFLAKVGNINLVRLALSNGADPNCIDKGGWTPLHAAASLGHYEVAKHLLEKGAKMITTEAGTPIHLASVYGHPNLVTLFLAKGAAVDSLNMDGWTPLIIAVRNGHLEVTKLLLTKDPNLDLPIKFGWTALHIAANEGRQDIANLLLEKGSNTEVMVEEKWTPIHFAAHNGDLEMVRCLAERGSKIDPASPGGWGPVHSAANKGHVKVVEFLQGKGSNVQNIDMNGWSPLHAAADNGHLEVVKFLQKTGSSIQSIDINRCAPLHHAAKNGHLEIIEFLSDKGADIEAKNIDGQSPLYCAASNGHVSVVKLLLDKGADQKDKNHYGWTPLDSASRNGHAEVVKLLLERGADPNAENAEGLTALCLASDRGHLEVVRLLLNNNANPTVSKGHSWAPLKAASDAGYLDVVKLLLDNGADPEAVDVRGWAPLHSASWFDHVEILKLFLDNGVNPKSRGVHGWTPLHIASNRGNVEAVKLFLNNGADTDVADIHGNTALHYASWFGHLEVIKLLLEGGADPATKAPFGRTILCLASTRGHLDIVKYLLGEGFNVSVRDESGCTPLLNVATVGQLETFKVLLEETLQVMLGNRKQPKRLSIMLKSEDQQRAANPCAEMSSGSLLHMTDNCGRTPLFLAARYGHGQLVQVFLDRVAYLLNAKDWCGSTALSAAVRHGHVAVVEQLLKFSEVDMNTKDKFGGTCIWWAKSRGFTQAADLLFRKSKERGIILDDAEPLGSFGSRSSQSSTWWCDACLLDLADSENRYICNSCHNLDICLACYKAGCGCVGTFNGTEGHRLMLKEA